MIGEWNDGCSRIEDVDECKGSPGVDRQIVKAHAVIL